MPGRGGVSPEQTEGRMAFEKRKHMVKMLQGSGRREYGRHGGEVLSDEDMRGL